MYLFGLICLIYSFLHIVPGVVTLTEGVLLPAIHIHQDIRALHNQGVDVLDLEAMITPLLLEEGNLHGMLYDIGLYFA